MKHKLYVGQVVMYNGDPYLITSRFKEDHEWWFMLGLHDDTGYDCAQAKGLRRLTKKEAGR